jgi:hypothetical protein
MQIRETLERLGGPQTPNAPRVPDLCSSSGSLEELRNAGDRLIGAALSWTARNPSPDSRQAETILRQAVREQLKIEIARTPPSMLTQIATGSSDMQS